MLDAAWHDAKLACLQFRTMVAKLDNHPAAPNEKELVLVFVMMPREDAGELDELQFLAVQLGHDLGPPMLVKERELFGEGSFVHGVRAETPDAPKISDCEANRCEGGLAGLRETNIAGDAGEWPLKKSSAVFVAAFRT